MRDVLHASLDLPAVVFTGLGAIVALLWIVSLSGILDLEGVDDAVDGVLDDALEPLGLAEVPAMVLLSIVAIFGWAVSVLCQVYLLEDVDGGTLTLLAVLVGVVSLAIAMGIAAMVGPRIGRLLQTTPTFRSADLVGRTAEIRSTTVTSETGYADAHLADGTTSRVSVRRRSDGAGPTDLRSGDVVVLVHYEADDNVYLVDALPPELAH